MDSKQGRDVGIFVPLDEELIEEATLEAGRPVRKLFQECAEMKGFYKRRNQKKEEVDGIDTG